MVLLLEIGLYASLWGILLLELGYISYYGEPQLCLVFLGYPADMVNVSSNCNKWYQNQSSSAMRLESTTSQYTSKSVSQTVYRIFLKIVITAPLVLCLLFSPSNTMKNKEDSKFLVIWYFQIVKSKSKKRTDTDFHFLGFAS